MASAMQAAEVVVVGAGPAGSALAYLLARQGQDVMIIERRAFPRAKACGEYLSPAVLSALDALGLSDVVADAHPLHALVLRAYEDQPLRLRLPGGGARALARETFDQRLLERALRAGARLQRGGYMRNNGKLGAHEIHYRDEHGIERTCRARVLVGADGAWSAVAARNGMADTMRRGGRWAVGGHLRAQPLSDALEMFVGPQGYYAYNPLSAETANAMVVLPRPVSLAGAPQAVAALTGGQRVFDPALLQRPVAAGPLRYSARSLLHNGVLLTGDAAALLDPFTGQGIACALSHSFAASDAVNGLLRGDAQDGVRKTYVWQWRRSVGDRRLLGWVIDRLLRTAAFRRRARRVALRDQTMAEYMLAAVSGAIEPRAAFAPKFLWRLVA